MLSLIKPVPIILTFITMFGVLMHDTRIDKVSVSFVSTAAVATSTGALEKAITPNYHTHVERVSLQQFPTFRSSLPNIQPPRDDDRRYIQNKKLMYMGGGDAVSIWPSV